MSQDRYTELFLEEATEHIDDLSQNLLILEREGHNPDVINNIFRSAHTLKSSAAFVGLDRLSAAAHSMEDLLQKIKDSEIDVSTHLINVLFHALDRIKRTVQLFSEGEPAEDDFEDLIEEIRVLVEPVKKAVGAKKSPSLPAVAKTAASIPKQTVSAPTSAAPQQEEATPTEDKFENLIKQLTAKEKSELAKIAASKKIFSGSVKVDDDAPMKNIRFILLIENLKKIAIIHRTDPSIEELETNANNNQFRFIVYGETTKDALFHLCQIDMVEDIFIKEIKTATASEKKDATRTALKKENAAPVPQEETRVQTKNIKVSADKIDYLMNNVGESVITNSGLMKVYEDLYEKVGDNHILTDLKSKIEGASRIARDLQSGIMKMRMIPVNLVFHRFTRPVRDMSNDLNKKVDLVFQGEDTELDKNIIDALTDPLLHLIRNSMDHGIELPEEREKKGKSPTATLTLNSYQSGNNIFIEIKDDGRGLDREKILSKAVQLGLITKDSPLTEDEIYELIFHPGFSTADKVSDLSGRGVGMNVVKTMVQKFNGGVRIQTEKGAGTAFILSFPLTLAILSAILVRVGNEEYAFPLSDVVENIKINKNDITTLEGRSIYNLRGEILPIFHLRKLMGNKTTSANEEFPVIIISSNNRKIGFIVDSLIGKNEIVIKSLEQNFHSVPGLIGACIMGDGHIVSVLDARGVLELAYERNNEANKIAGELSEKSFNATKEYNKQIEELDRLALELSGQKIGTKSDIKMKMADNPNANPVSHAVDRPYSTETFATTTLQGAKIISGQSSPASLPKPTAPNFHEELTPPSPPLKTTPSNSREEEEKRISEAIQNLEKDREYKHKLASDASLPEHSSVTVEMSEQEYAKLYEITNTGMMNSGLVLSQLLGVTVEISVPELKLVNANQLIDYIPRQNIISVFLGTEGDFESILLLVFDEKTGYKAAGDLMGLPAENWDSKNISFDDLQSVLSELTNIVGASLLNALANATGKKILPTVPSFIYGGTDQLLEKLDTLQAGKEKFHAIYISTDFYREDMELLGRLFLFLPHHSLSELI